MSEQKNNMDFTAFDEEELDLDAIFGSIGKASQPAEEQTAAPAQSVTARQQPPPEAPVVIPAQPTAENPIAEAFKAQSEAEAGKAAQSLFEKLPVFTYGGATEKIEDASMTFEDLRIAKAEDFPELSDGKKVTWTVEYGKVSKPVADPKGTVIASVKKEIERSKAFLDGLKKAKEKERNPDCLVKPKVTAQSKGIAAYKGVFTTLEEARESDKVICLIPAQNGKIYEMRRNELGEFIAEARQVREFSLVRAGFDPALPLIPFSLLQKVIAFFRSCAEKWSGAEALVHICWDKTEEEYVVFVPKQEVWLTGVKADLSNEPPNPDRYIHYADIHSHGSMKAKFSRVDDADERATRLYLVVGRLDKFFPDISARVSCGGIYQKVDLSLVLEGFNADFPKEWNENVRCKTRQPEVAWG